MDDSPVGSCLAIVVSVAKELEVVGMVVVELLKLMEEGDRVVDELKADSASFWN